MLTRCWRTPCRVGLAGSSLFFTRNGNFRGVAFEQVSAELLPTVERDSFFRVSDSHRRLRSAGTPFLILGTLVGIVGTLIALGIAGTSQAPKSLLSRRLCRSRYPHLRTPPPRARTHTCAWNCAALDRASRGRARPSHGTTERGKARRSASTLRNTSGRTALIPRWQLRRR